MKKVLSVLVVLSMLLSLFPTTVSAAHWADEDVAYLVENGAIAEDDTMLQNLDTPITRSQMVKVIVALLDGDEPIEGKEYFTDITADDTHIAKAAENGFVNGFGDGTFRPNNPITRQDFFTIVGRAYKLESEATNEFTDADSIADYAKPHIDALQCIGIVNGYGDGTIRPLGNITIAETLAVMHRVDEYVKANAPKEEETPKPKPSGGSSGGGGGGFSGGGPGANGSGGNPVYKPEISVEFTIEYVDDYSSGIVAYVTADITNNSNLPIKRKVMIRGTKDTVYSPTSPYGGPTPPTWRLARQGNMNILEEDNKFAIPDFGPYTLIIVDESDEVWDTFEVNVNPPKSEDTIPPTLTVEVPEETALPFEIKVNASDNVKLARLTYVLSSTYDTTTSYKEKGYKYKIKPNIRHDITDGSLTVKTNTAIVICAMDSSGNCTYAEIKVNKKPIVVNYEEESISEYDDTDTEYPNISYTLSTTEECDGELTITTDISDKKGIAESGWFFMREYNNLNGVDQVKTAHMLNDNKLDFDDDLLGLIDEYDEQCGGVGSVCILANYHQASKEPIENNTIIAKENGAYFVYAKNTSGDLTVVRVDVDNVKVSSATFTIEHAEDASSEYVAHITATVDANPNAPVKQMFVVKSDYEPETAGAYRAYTPNGKAQKIWDEVSVSGEYIPVEESKFSVPEYGTYSLYMLDEYGNWGVSEVEVNAPESDDVTPNAEISVDFDVVYLDDYSSGIVARIIPTITKDPELELGTLLMIRGTKDTYYLPNGGYGGRPSTAQTVLSHNINIPDEDGVYNVSCFGPHTLIILDKSTGEELNRSEVMVKPKDSNDTIPPTLEIEIPEEISYPLEIKVKAKDDVKLSKLDYVQVYRYALTSYKDKGYIYKMNPLGRKDITDGIIATENSNIIAIRAMDSSGNCTYATLVYNNSDKTMNVEYESESIADFFVDE